MRRTILWAAALLLVCVPGRNASAHPHVWLDCEMLAEFDAGGLAGFRQTWTFDEMFSATILAEVDLDGDKVISEEENALTRKTAFNNLRNYGYFTDIRVDGDRFDVGAASEFRCWVDDRDRLVYRFFLPCAVPARENRRNVIVGVYDKTFYADVGYVDGLPGLGGESEAFAVSRKEALLDDIALDVINYAPKAWIFSFGPAEPLP